MVFIPYNPPGKTGSQAAHGINPAREAITATFLLHMYQETGNTTYLKYVEETADWLIPGPDIQSENGGYKWRANRPYGTLYPISGQGAAEIGLFFFELYEEIGNTTFQFIPKR